MWDNPLKCFKMARVLKLPGGNQAGLLYKLTSDCGSEINLTTDPSGKSRRTGSSVIYRIFEEVYMRR